MASLFENARDFIRGLVLTDEQRKQIQEPFTVKKDKNSTEFGTDWDVKDVNVVSASHYITPYGNYNYGDASSRAINDLILRYREVSLLSYVSDAVDEIVNEMVVFDDQPGDTVFVDFNDPEKKLPSPLIESIKKEFNVILDLLNFDDEGTDFARQWYIDGRMVFQTVVDTANLKAGITKIKPMSPLNLSRKFDIDHGRFYWEYEETFGDPVNGKPQYTSWYGKSVKDRIIPDELMVYVPSGLYVRDSMSDKVSSISYLHPALRDIYRLDVLEEHVIIFRLVRSAERRVFYIDSMDLPPKKAEEYLKSIINSYRQKKTYDSDQNVTGLRTKAPSMVEDIFLLRRNEKGTEVTTLPGGSLGDLSDLTYFKQRVSSALKTPFSRATQEKNEAKPGGLSSTANEITSEELKFMKFIKRIQNKFSVLFHKLLFRQLVYKQIVRPEEWADIKRKLKFVWKSDAMFSEAKRIKNLTEKINLLTLAKPFEGVYFSRTDIFKKILGMSDTEISQLETRLQEEKSKYSEGYGTPPGQ